MVHIPTDLSHLYNSPISTGGHSAGTGAPGTNSGAITNNAHIDFQPTATATAGDVHTDTGNHVYHVDQSVSADTTAYQGANVVYADMSQNVLAGVGGPGGDGNTAYSGDVHLHV